MEEDYRGAHQAPDPEFGGPMHNLAGTLVSADFYDKMHYYRFTDDPSEKEAMGLIRQVRNKPTQSVSIYRAIPKDAPKDTGINPGDWVTPTRSYAVEHGRSVLSNQFRIVHKIVQAQELYTAGDDWREWGYHPQSD